ncbi:MAG: hypothetical protein WDO24_04700 [Pseudomonadota bacterium]
MLRATWFQLRPAPKPLPVVPIASAPAIDWMTELSVARSVTLPAVMSALRSSAVIDPAVAPPNTDGLLEMMLMPIVKATAVPLAPVETPAEMPSALMMSSLRAATVRSPVKVRLERRWLPVTSATVAAAI